MKCLAVVLLLYSCCAACLRSDRSSRSNVTTYRAAVFDQFPILTDPLGEDPIPREEALVILENALRVYAEQCQEASVQGSDIIVFAEYGLVPVGLSRDTVYPFLESIPAPDATWRPCDEQHTQGIEVQAALSCMAKNHSIYVVANMGDKVPCDTQVDPHCPTDGRYQYNTNVVYDAQGYHVARYHKKELFFEDHYDVPQHLDLTYFDTPFGRFGTFVCFDVLFDEPAVRLIEDYDIDTVAFPTAWMNVEPFYSACPFHQSFAINMGVNFLAANLHFPLARFSGSGIYSPTDTHAYRNSYTSLSSELLIADVPVKATRVPFLPPDLSHLVIEDPDFQGIVFEDRYNFRVLPAVSVATESSVCHNGLCCHVSYMPRDGTFVGDEFFVLGAFKGLHVVEGVYYIEVCVVMRCAGATRESCSEDPPRTSRTVFPVLELSGNFTTSYVHPQLVQDGMNATQTLWSWDGTTIRATPQPDDQGLVSSTLFGRRYDLDDVLHPLTAHQGQDVEEITVHVASAVDDVKH